MIPHPFVYVLVRPNDPKPYPMCCDCVDYYKPGSESGAVFTVTEIRAMGHGLFDACWSCGIELVRRVSS